ncbi:MAG: ATP-binding protein [Anaerolineae bacterium]
MKAQARLWAWRIWDLISAVSVRTKIMGIVLSLMLLLGTGVTIQVQVTMSRILNHELDQQAIFIARDLAARSTDLILTHNLYALHELVRDTAANNKDLRYAFVLDARGRVLVHSFDQGVPPGLLTVNPVQPSDRYHLQILDTEEGLIHDVAVPIFDGRAGTARVGLSERRLRAQMAATTCQLAFITLLVSLVGVLSGYLLTWVLTRPIKALVGATQAVARGDLSQRAPLWADDEIGTLAGSFNAMVEELERAREEVQRKEAMRGQLLQKIITVQEEERKRIARELHDQTGQALTSLLVGLRTLEDEPNHPARLQELKAIVTDTLDGVRNLALELRPSVLDDLGLVPALQRYVRTCATRHQLAVDFQTVALDGLRLPAPVETALYRIVQEALTNIIRHAHARQVSLLLEVREGAVVAIVEDDGCGFAVDSLWYELPGEHRLGLHGMRERAELLGGTLTIESVPGAGTTVVVELPLSEEQRGYDGQRADPGADC